MLGWFTWFKERASIVLFVLAVFALMAMGWSLTITQNKLREERASQAMVQRDLDSALRDRDAMRDAILAIGRADQAQRDREARLTADIEGINRAPVTSGCGPVVHDTVDRLRAHSAD